MKKLLLLILVFIFCCKQNETIAQQRVAVHSNSVTTIFTSYQPLVDAYNASINGDTLYVSGGVFTIPTINKQLVIIGAGHNPDSTIATGRTVINQSLSLGADADSLVLEGVYINGGLSFTNNVSINYVKFLRCFVNGGINISGGLTNPSIYTKIYETVVNGNINGQNTDFMDISNSVIHSVINLNNGVVQNSIIYSTYFGYPYYYNTSFVACYNTLINNNIIFSTQSTAIYSSGFNTVTNNIFNVPQVVGSNNFSNNWDTISQSNIFINHPNTTFFYSNDYHLISPTLYLGIDASQVGIYGGISPFKEGSVPRNPHFQQKTIAPYTNPTGGLNINIKVKAQTN